MPMLVPYPVICGQPNLKGTLLTALLTLVLVGCGKGDAGAAASNDGAQLPNEVTMSRHAPGRLGDAQVVVVSGYEADGGDSGLRHVKVTVKIPDRKVLLVLTSHHQVHWEVAGLDSTRFNGVLVSAGQDSTLHMDKPVSAWTIKLPYTEKAEGDDLKALQAELNKVAEISRINVLRASKSIPGSVEITQVDAQQPPIAYQAPKNERETKGPTFELVTADHRLSKWSFDGPVVERDENYASGGKVVVSPSGTKVYELKSDGLTITDRGSGKLTIPSLPDNFPRFSWAMDLAYDTKRNHVTIVSLGGEGYLYRFDAAAEKWLDVRSVNNVDFSALAYDPRSDLYFAWTTDNKLVQINGEGDAVRSDDVTNKLSGWSGIIGDKPSMNNRVVTLAGAGKDVAIIAFDGAQVKRIWRYDREAQSASIAYRGK